MWFLEMEGNKDDAEICLKKAKTFLQAGDIDKARKFAKKSMQLFPSENAECLF
jgi:hypothetical protein